MTFKFGVRSEGKLVGVHEDLKKVIYASITNSPHDFSITEGVRSKVRQTELYHAGKSQTMNSRHLTGHAVDIAVIKDGKADWSFALYEDVADHILKVSSGLLIPVVWGGSWTKFKDGVHFELDRSVYK